MTTASDAQVPTRTKLPRNVWIMTLTSFFTDISSEMILNMISLFLANVLHAPTSLIGLIEGAAETLNSVLKVLSGWFSDKVRKRKSLAVIGYGVSAFTKPLLYVVTSWVGVLGVRLADRTGKGIRSAPRDALLADSVDAKHRGAAFGLHRAGDTAGAVLGLLIALAVVLAMQSQTLDLHWDTFRMLVIFSAIPGFIAVVLLAFGAREATAKAKPAGAAPSRLTLNALGPRFRAFLLIVCLFTLGNSADAFLILRAQERGLSVAGILAMLICFNVIYAALSGPAGSLSDRIGRQRLIIFGWLMYALIYLGFGLAQEIWQIWALYALYGLYYGAADGTARALVADLVPSEQRGSAYGYYNAAVGLMALPASIIAGVLWQGIGPATPFLFGALLAFVAIVAFVLWNRQAQPAA